jgi:hypothetical protein
MNTADPTEFVVAGQGTQRPAVRRRPDLSRLRDSRRLNTTCWRRPAEMWRVPLLAGRGITLSRE